MVLKTGLWNVAYRKKEDGYLVKNTNKKFSVISNGRGGWAADPFLFDKDGETYLFVEYFSYKIGHGVIAYSKYNQEKEKFENYKPIIKEKYHLSYPLVFTYKNDIYMMPESSESNSLYVYKAKKFPEEWEKLPPLINDVKVVDTTPFVVDNKIFAFSYKINELDESKSELILLNFDGSKFVESDTGTLSDDFSSARPGGKLLFIDNEVIRVSQDSIDEYGRALNFLSLSDDFTSKFDEKLIKKIEARDINTETDNNFCGVHTYNVSEKFEVVDLKSYKNNFVRLFYRLFNR